MANASFHEIVCLGGGNSAGYLAKELVASGKLEKEALCIITSEPVVAYERPALSKAYLAPTGPARLPGFHTCIGGGGERQEASWYVDKGISYLTSTTVTEADLKAKTLTLSSGSKVSFGKLVIATGARPIYLSDFKTPGADLAGVHYLRSEADAAALVKGIEETKAAGGKAVAIGGGYIGMEVAAGLAQNGLNTTMVYPEPHIMSRLFTPKLAEFYENFYREKGITLLKGGKVTELEGANGKVTHVIVGTAGGTDRIQADLVVVGVGARANTDLFSSQLELALGGIKVDDHCRTSVPDVYAMGDVATFPLKQNGGELARQEHVVNCRQMAAQVAKELTGAGGNGYDYLPYFYSRIWNLFWQFYGLNNNTEAVHFQVSEGKFGAFFVKDGKVVGAFLESGSPEENNLIKKIAAERPSAPPSDELEKLGLAFASKI